MKSAKRYQLLADVIKEEVVKHSSNHDPVTCHAIEELAVNMCKALRRDNPKFKPAYFLTAAGLGDRHLEGRV